jgi:microcystin-dependent protein
MPIGLNDEKTVGTVISGTSNTVPHGFLLCNGSQVSRTVYNRLFSVISTTYGNGDGSTTFTLPDFVGAVPRGAGTSSGYTQNITVTLGSKQDDASQGHRHVATSTTSDTYIKYSPGSGSEAPGGGSNGISSFTPSITIGSPNSDGTNGTPRTESETRMKNLGVNFFIKF